MKVKKWLRDGRWIVTIEREDGRSIALDVDELLDGASSKTPPAPISPSQPAAPSTKSATKSSGRKK